MNQDAGAGLLDEDALPAVGDVLAEQTYRVLRRAILDHRMTAGTRLSVPDVARRLGVSRTPAREAIARIAADGLATVEPRRGAIVARITVEDLTEIYELREVLEGLACRLAVERATKEQVAELRDLVREHRTAIESRDVERHKTLDQEFHASVRRAAGNQRLIESLDRLQSQIRLAMETTRFSPGGMPLALAEHEQILNAIEANDPGVAESAARGHVARLREGLRLLTDLQTPAIDRTEGTDTAAFGSLLPPSAKSARSDRQSHLDGATDLEQSRSKGSAK